MNLRPKTKRRLLILLTAGAGGFALAFVVVVIQLHRYENHRLAYREAGMTAFKRSDYRTAADNFAKYLGNDRMDSPAIYDYAVCRSKLPRADFSNLTEAKDLFNRYLELNPGDIEAQHQLLDIYQKLRYSAETMDLSDQLLAKNPDDVTALSARLGELVHQHNFDAALAVAMHLDDLTPSDLQTQSMTYELMQHLHRPPVELTDRADGMLAAHPGDPRFELLRAVAAYSTGDRDSTARWLKTAAARTPPDAEFILMLAGAFDRMEMWGDSRKLLETNATAPTASVTLKANFAQRLWEIGQYDQALVLLKGVSPADPAADSDLVGLQTLVKFSLNPSDGFVKNSITLLQQRQDDLVAGAWGSLFTALTENPPADPLEPIHLCQSARRSDPQNPDADFYLGREFLRIGETESAMQVLRQTVQMQPEWAAPYAMMARAWLDRGQITFAGHAIDAAYQRDPQNAAIDLLFGLVHYQLLPQTAAADTIRPVLNFIVQLRAAEPADSQLFAAEVDLLARSNQRQAAIDLATNSVAKPTGSMLLELARVDQVIHLGLDGFLADRLADAQPTTPDEAVDQVRADLLTGNPQAARALLTAIQNHPTPGWTLASLQARDLLGDQTAGKAWAEFADTFNHDLSIQQAAVHSPAMNADRALADRTIDRLKNLTGDGAIEWKIDRARWQLSSTDDIKNSAAAAAASMAEVSRLAPDYAPPQQLWADALIKLGDPNGATLHLRMAAQIEPDNTSLSLQLARLYLQQGQIHDASLLLGSVQSNPFLTDPQRIDIALLFRQIGDRARAIQLLDDNQPMHLNDVQRDLLLAQLHAEQGENPQARALYSAWAAQPDCPIEMLSAFADYCAGQGSMTDAQAALDQIKSKKDSVADRDLALAQFQSAWGNQDLAAAGFERCTSEAPQQEKSWLAWAGMHLRAGDFSDAFNAADQGLKHLPASSVLLAMKARAQELAGLQLDENSADLLNSLSVDPASDAGVATLKALTSSETPTDAEDHLKAVAQLYPNYLPVQSMLIRRDFRSGDYDSAVDRATRLLQTLPNDPEPAQLLSMIYSAAHQYAEALAAAQEWRNRSLNRPHPADLAIAAAELGSHQPQDAGDQLSWSLQEPDAPEMDRKENPPLKAKALELYAKALCQQDRADEAWRIMQPYAARSAIWRRRWLRTIAATAPDLLTASERVQQVFQLIQAGSADDELSLGEAWSTLGNRFDNSAALDKSKILIQPLTAIPSCPAETWMLLGSIDQQQNNLPDADIAFAAALKLSPDLPTALNNRAMLMLLRNQNLTDAQNLATRAAQLAPTSSAFHSTLAEIDLQLNDLDSAKMQFQRAVRLNVENAEALIGLAWTQYRQGDLNGMSFILRQAELVIQTTDIRLPAAVKNQLNQLREIDKKAATSAAVR